MSTGPRRLNDTSATSAEIFKDLGTRTSYGTSTIREADRIVSLRLNDAAVAALNAGRGGYVSLGGRVVQGRDYSFGATGQTAQRLVITLQ